MLEEARPLQLANSSFEAFPPKLVAWLWDRLLDLKWEVQFYRWAHVPISDLLELILRG